MADERTPHDCDAVLRADPSYDPFRCQPSQWMCTCGRAWAHVCDEAEGCFMARIETADARSIDARETGT